MASVITVNLNEAGQLAQKLNSHALTPSAKKLLLKGLGLEVEEQTKERFDTETDPGGNKWRELTEAYAERKSKKSSGGILTFGGFLKNSIEFQLQGDNAVLTGATAEYADYHQNAKKEERRRKFLGLHTNDINDLQDLIDVFMEKRTA
jgi:phage virion morphogenesis protein